MNDDKDMMDIQLRVDGAYFPMTIPREEEGFYRDAARRIDNLLNMYRGSYVEQDKLKYMTMVAIHLSVMTVKLEKKHDTQPYKEKLEELTRTLENYLKGNGQ